MDRTDRTGLAIAIAGHVLLFGALSLGLMTTPKPLPRLSEPVDVQLVDAIGLRSEAPKVTQEAPAPSAAPEIGPPADAAPPEPAPAPPAPRPESAPPPPPAPPEPAPEPAPAPRPTPPRPAPRPAPKPAPKAPPRPPAPAKETPAPKAPPAKAPPKAAPAKAPPKAAPAAPAPAKSAPAPAASAKATPKAAPGRSAGTGTRAKASGGAIGADFLKGITPEKSAGKAQTPRAAAVGQAQLNGLAAAIKRQVQPCYERKGIVGPGAERIITVLRLRFDPDGSLSARPTRSEQTGIDDENRRYATRAAEVAIASVMECTPLKLPAELYENGWRDIEAGFSQVAR